jgi:hypothetical protein
MLKNEDGNYILRSSITSFGLNQVTDKDIVSFYKYFSSTASFDTGLIPLDGTGVLSIRSAGHHMQIAIQHAPGCYYINWGDIEGDRNASTYYLAQPYRIVVGDFVNGNLLGARMFYSPISITHPNQPLYHVNLPNINCKGYRGNGVGWICLYLKEDWSTFSFNEKVAKLIERCSGVETYNDANMSETDGPRFYMEQYKKNYGNDFKQYDYLWYPNKWQEKSFDKNGKDNYSWTLNQDLWIPILVENMDSQESHYPGGIPLTFSMALLGNYQAYYTDRQIPKLYNVVARKDLDLTNSQIADMIKSSFALAPAIYQFDSKDNPYNFSVEHREKKAITKVTPQLFNDDGEEEQEEEEEETWTCECCSEEFVGGENDVIFDYNGNCVCSTCASENYVYLETPSEWYPKNSEYVFYANNLGLYLHSELDNCFQCGNCDHSWGALAASKIAIPVYEIDSQGNYVCENCIKEYAEKNGYEEYLEKCSACGKNHVINNSVTFPNSFYRKTFAHPMMKSDGTLNMSKVSFVYCAPCASKDKTGTYTCPCGLLQDATNKLVSCKNTKLKVGPNEEFIAEVSACCGSCISNFEQNKDGNLVGEFVPFNKDIFEYSVINFTASEKSLIHGAEIHFDVNKVVF